MGDHYADGYGGAAGGCITAVGFFLRLIKERGRNKPVISHSPPPGRQPTNGTHLPGLDPWIKPLKQSLIRKRMRKMFLLIIRFNYVEVFQVIH